MFKYRPRATHPVMQGSRLVVCPQHDRANQHEDGVYVGNAAGNNIPHEEAHKAYAPTQSAAVGSDDLQPAGHLSESCTAILQHQNLVATSREEKNQKESDKAKGCKRRVGCAGRIACLSPRADQIWYEQSGEDQDGNRENKAVNEARAETDPKSAVTPGQWRCPSSAARHHPAQKCRLAIRAPPVSGDLDQIRVRERPAALGTRQNCLYRGFWTHWVSSLVCKVALSLAQVAPRAKYYYLAPKAMTLAIPLDTVQTWIALWSLTHLDHKLFRHGNQFLVFCRFRLLDAREAHTAEACPLAGRLGRDDQGDVLHLLARGHSLVAKVGAVRDFEGHGAKPAKAAEDRLFAFAKTLLNMSPVACPAHRLFVAQRSFFHCNRLHKYCF